MEELIQPNQVTMSVTSAACCKHELQNPEIKFTTKNGNQHRMNTPMTIPRVLAAFFSLANLANFLLILKCFRFLGTTRTELFVLLVPLLGPTLAVQAPIPVHTPGVPAIVPTGAPAPLLLVIFALFTTLLVPWAEDSTLTSLSLSPELWWWWWWWCLMIMHPPALAALPPWWVGWVDGWWWWWWCGHVMLALDRPEAFSDCGSWFTAFRPPRWIRRVSSMSPSVQSFVPNLSDLVCWAAAR